MAISAQLKWVTALSLVKSQGKYKNKTQKNNNTCVSYLIFLNPVTKPDLAAREPEKCNF